MYKTILFDLDGTLTDPGEGITNSVAYALEKFGVEVIDKAELYKFIGPPLVESFAEFCGFSKEKSLLAVEYYREYFRDTGIFENKVYDGVEELLSRIKASGRKVVLATSKPEEFAKRILVHFGLDKYFDIVAGASMDSSRNKKGDVIKYALGLCGNPNPSTVVMIGDRKQDIIGAKQNGIDSIGVLYGYGNYDELHDAGANYIAESINDIFELL